MYDVGEHPGGRDYSAARKLYRRVVDDEDIGEKESIQAMAMVSPGSLIEKGLGGDHDFHEAATLYRRAFDTADHCGTRSEAALLLGGLYERGLGVETHDADEALRYYAIANKAGFPGAEDAIDSLIDRGLVSTSVDDRRDLKLRVCANCGLETLEKLKKCGRCIAPTVSGRD